MTGRIGAAVTVVLLAAAVGCGAGTGSGTERVEPQTSPSASASPQPSIVTSPPHSVAPTHPATVRPVPTVTPSARLLRPGDTGPEVVLLQQRLTALRYWLGAVDGTYGYLTEQAVTALQKAAGLERDGIFGPLTRHALQVRVEPRPRRTQSSGVEIDLNRQLLLIVRDGMLLWTFNTSTGSGQKYWLAGMPHYAVTPTGRYTVLREVDGEDVSPLGVLWRPKYFTAGIAIHGYADVPPYPASHGCVRVTIAAMDFLWSSGLLPIGTSVWLY